MHLISITLLFIFLQQLGSIQATAPTQLSPYMIAEVAKQFDPNFKCNDTATAEYQVTKFYEDIFQVNPKEVEEQAPLLVLLGQGTILWKQNQVNEKPYKVLQSLCLVGGALAQCVNGKCECIDTDFTTTKKYVIEGITHCLLLRGEKCPNKVIRDGACEPGYSCIKVEKEKGVRRCRKNCVTHVLKDPLCPSNFGVRITTFDIKKKLSISLLLIFLKSYTFYLAF